MGRIEVRFAHGFQFSVFSRIDDPATKVKTGRSQIARTGMFFEKVVLDAVFK